MATRTAPHPDPSTLAPDGAGSGERGSPQPLAPGTRLRDYEVQAVVSAGPSGFVYRAFDHSLQRTVALKEFVPDSIASRAPGSSAVVVGSERHFDAYRAALRSFVDEARLLARFEHPSLVKVYRFWEENGTAYRVMPFHDAPSLRAALAGLGRVPSEAELRAWLRPVLDAVAILHDGKVWHEHIAPGNILLAPSGPVLLGTAAARRTLAAQAHAPAAALEAGYAAIEQYGDEATATRGPWTDLYALAAIVYAAITGEPPQMAPDRLRGDRVKPLAHVAAGLYSAEFLAAVDAALSLQPARRPQDHLRFRALMGDIEAPERVDLAPRRDLMQELFISAAPAGESTVPDWPADAPPIPPRRAPPALPPAPAAAPSRPAPLGALSRPGELAAAGPRPRTPVAAAVPLPSSPARGARTADVRGRRGWWYGAVAISLVLVGVVALGLNFQSRQSRAPAASATAVAPPPTTSRSTPPTPTVSGSPPMSRGADPVAAVPNVASSMARPPAAAIPGASVAAMPADVQTRCLDILQKASLEPITAAETAFFRKECR